MENSAPQLTCSQCGGALTPAEGEIFLTCPYCRAAVYLDKSRVVFHWAITPTVDSQAAQANLLKAPCRTFRYCGCCRIFPKQSGHCQVDSSLGNGLDEVAANGLIAGRH